MFISEIQRELTGRHLDLWYGTNCTPEVSEAYRKKWLRQTRQKLILRQGQCPGDLVVLTAAIKSLHLKYPEKYLTDVRTNHPDVFKFNPHVTSIHDGEGRVIEMHYNSINEVGSYPHHFMEAYCRTLSEALGVPVPCLVPCPSLYVAPGEANEGPAGDLAGSHYALINCGYKRDYPAKKWGFKSAQEVVDLFPDVRWVQIGTESDVHQPLRGAINLVGKTTLRQLFALAKGAAFGLCGVTLLQHVLAAFKRPCVVVYGGREQRWFTDYQTQISLHTGGSLPCSGGCWVDDVQPPGTESNRRLCSLPVQCGNEWVGKCMSLIGTKGIVNAVDGIVQGFGMSRKPRMNPVSPSSIDPRLL